MSTAQSAGLSRADRQPRVQLADVQGQALSDLTRHLERLRTHMNMAIVFGGDKTVEGAVINPTINPRSWKSYESVAEDIAAALRRIGFRNVVTIPEDMRLGDRLQRENIHLAWLNTGGVQGFNPVSHAAAMLEMLGVPYIGHDPLTAGTLDNKHMFKRDLMCLGIPTAPSITWHMARGPFRPRINSRFIRAFKNHRGAFVVKPVSGRASLHVHVVDDVRDLPDAVAEVFEVTANHVLIEAYLPGREYCVAVSGPVVAGPGQIVRKRDPFIFSCVERVLGADERIVTSMDVKPITTDRIRCLDPIADADELMTLRQLAREVYLDFSLEAMVRLDVRADQSGKMFVLEANPKPDLKQPSGDKLSIVCAGLAAEGMDYDDLIFTILANRLDYLLNHRKTAVPELFALLKQDGL